MKPVVTNDFPKQPRETKWLPISFAEQIEAQGDPARGIDPIELDAVPPDLTVEAAVFNALTGLYQLQVSGGLHGKTYLLTMWLHTVSGQRLEHQVRVKVKEKTS